ncbi:unnamed protein product [Protopolystoma xenopodis]|uniref:Uncharacterized protein n=1 Tax=Protopolystoma xenopodis TaxID=117903 RepID=A0A3S5FFL8_9PLAT|nr:unnamed protein product [Protopolystoma xenopodis]
MCTSICFCPILPSTIAEDGSKPRWLDKSPAAAAVHEHHFTATTSPHKLFPNDPQAAQASPLHISSGESTNPSIATTASSAPNSSSSTSCLPSSLTSLNEQLTTSSTSPSSCSTALCASGNGGGVVIVVEGACCRLDDSNDQLATEQSCRQIDHLLLASEDVDWTSLSLNREQMSVNEPTEAPLQSVDADGDLLGQPIRNQLVLPVSVAPFDNFSTPSTSCPATTFLSPPPVSCLAVDKSRQSAFYQLTSNMLPMGGLTLTLPTGLSVPELAYTDVEEQLLCGKQITSGDPMTVDEEGSYLHSSSSSSSSSSCSSSSSVSLSSVGGASRPSCLQKDPHYFMDCISDKGSVGNHRGRTPGVNADCLDAELMLPHGIEKFEGTTGTAITPLEQVFVLPSRQISYPTATSIVAGTAITTTALEAVERMSVDARAASSDGFIFLNESSTRHSDLLTSEYLHMAEPPRPLDSGLLGTSLLAGLPFDICAVGNSGGTARNTGSHCLCAKQTSGSSEVVEEIREEEDEDEDGEEEDTEEVDEEETEVYNENFLSRITEAQCLADSTLSSDTTSHDSKFAHSIANANSDKGVSVTMLTNANSRLLTEKAVVRNLNTTARSESVTGSSDNLELDLLCLAGGPDSKMEIEPAAANHQLGWRQIGDNFHQQHHQDFQHQPQAQRHMDISTKQCAMPNLAETNTFCRPDEPVSDILT